MRGTIWLTLVGSATLTLLPAVATADVLHLKNGRTLEGKVVSERGETIALEVRGGMFRVPRATVLRIERRASPQEEYAARLKKTDLEDPRAVEALAHWASARGLGEQARGLRRIAAGQRLAARVAAAREAKDAGAFVQTFHWARKNAFGEPVLRYLLEAALELDPAHEPARRELRRLPAPALEGPALPDQARDDEAAAPSPEKTSGQAPDAEPERVSDLERRLAEQKGEAEALRKRLEELERRQEGQARQDRLDRRRLRRARQGGGGLFIGPYRVDPAPRRDPCPTSSRRAPCPPAGPSAGGTTIRTTVAR